MRERGYSQCPKCGSQEKSNPPEAATVLSEIFGKYLTRWRLLPDGDPIFTPGSRLLPVRMDGTGTPAMLKIAMV